MTTEERVSLLERRTGVWSDCSRRPCWRSSLSGPLPPLSSKKSSLDESK